MPDDRLTQLKNECKQLATTGDKRALPALKNLKGLAEQTNDTTLFGFAEYYYANYYHDRADYEKARKHLVRAVRYLLRGNDRELLARAYNYFGVDASENGAFDIAYSYYLGALQFVEDRDDSTAKSLAFINLACMFSELGYHARATRFFRKGIRLMEQFINDPFYTRNMVIALSVEGLNMIALGEVSSAEKTLRRMRRIYEGAGDTELLDAKILFAVFEARLALETNDRKLVRQKAGEIVSALRSDASPHVSIDNTYELFHAMMKHGFVREAGQITEAIKPHVESGGVTYARNLLTELQADYYERTGNKAALMACLSEQNKLLLRMQAERKVLCRYSIDMIQLVTELKAEERLVRKENLRLRVEAETDALTGVPNRYAMEREIEVAFEQAYAGKTRFGVGLLDINDFKTYNDTYGHEAGDACLVLLGKALKTLAEDERVFCARFGGDEFLIVYRNMTDEEIREKTGVLSDALSDIRLPLQKKTRKQRLTVSQGICNDIPGKKSRPWDYLSSADAALYTLKNKRTKAEASDLFLLRNLPDTYR